MTSISIPVMSRGDSTTYLHHHDISWANSNTITTIIPDLKMLPQSDPYPVSGVEFTVTVFSITSPDLVSGRVQWCQYIIRCC